MNRFQWIIDLREAIGGRRFSLTLGCGVVCSLLVACKAIDGAVFATIILGTVGVYITGNTAQKVMARKAELMEPDDGQNSGV